MEGYKGLHTFFGDIHNHCAVGYGHGSLEDAYQNARMQLDFACVTVHAYWPDMPIDNARLAPVVAYHQMGFDRSSKAWPQVREVVEANYVPGHFVTYLGFEWHSLAFGDHNVYFKGSTGDIIRAASLEEMRQALRQYKQQGINCMVVPHHIGYKQGYRGINWSAYTSELSPVVEIISMHGASESADAPYPYLHTMGPRDWESTYQYGLAQGHIVGVIGSTDHHSAHPGSYGHGRLAVWARDLSRDSIWEAIQDRRTVALTGDNITVAFSINDQPLGSVLPATRERHLKIAVEGGSALDYLDIVYNNRVIHRHQGNLEINTAHHSDKAKVHLEVGWAEKNEDVNWQVECAVNNGDLLSIEPRFRGHEIVAPQANEEEAYAFSQWNRFGKNGVTFTTRTWGNPTTTTASSQGVCLEVQGGADTQLKGTANGVPFAYTLVELLQGPRATYLGGFLTPAVYLNRAIPKREYACEFSFQHEADSDRHDWYYLRVRQKNGQWAWSSPIWVEGFRDE